VADLAEQDMWATEAADPINNFVAGDWTQIPFRAETRAGESEYDFDTGGGANTGDITFTDDEIGSTSNVVNINASSYAQLQSGNVYIWAEQGEGAYVQSGDSYTWQFGTDGALILPNGSTIGDGDAVSGVPITTSRGTILLGNQAECAGGESHFHIMPGGQQAIDLFLGDDSNYVKLPNTGGVEIASTSNAQNIWTFGTDGNLTLPAGSILSETANTTVISPPGAAAGQSLVIRPTAVSALSASGYIVPGQNLTITLTNQSNGTLDATGVTYEITGATAQQLGIGSLTGTFPAFSPSGEVPQTTTVVLPIPEYTSATTFTLTVGGDNPWNTAFITVTDNGVIETSHIHLVAGDPATTDIYLGDDDQYVKIEKDGGDVVIGTDTNTKHWTFDTSGILTFPSGMTMGNTGAGDVIETTANSFIGILAQGSVGGVGVQWVNDYGNPTSVAGMIINSPFAANNTGAVQLITGAIDPSGPTSIEHTWTFGANGTVVVPGAIVAGVSNSKAYRGFYATVNQISEQDGGFEDDPSLNQIILSRSATMRGYNLSDDTNEDTFFANGITGSSHVAVINLYGADTSDPIPLEHIKTFVQTYIDLVLYDGTALRTDVAEIQTAFAAAQTDLVDSLPADTLRTDFEFNEIQAVINTAGMTTSGTGSGFVYYYNNDDRTYSGSEETTILVPGTGYQVGDTITVPGTALGGIAPADNMTITVDEVDGSGGITSIDRSGSMDSSRFANLFVKHFVYDGFDDTYDQGNFIGTDRSECVFTATANAATERITVSAVTSGELAPFQVFWSQNEDNNNYMILHQVSGTAGGAGVYATGGYDDIGDEANATVYTSNGIYYGINDPQYNSPAFGGGDYVSMVNTEVGIFTMVAVNADIDRVSYLGETGADGDGVKILTTDFDIGTGTVERLPIELVVGTNTWAFENTGNLTLPQTSNVGITFSDGTFQKTAYTRLDNLMLDGGAAAAIYEVTVDYAEGGFSSTRYGVNTPSFNGGGAEITEPTYYTLNGGGA
jgi:hypothetical protein